MSNTLQEDGKTGSTAAGGQTQRADSGEGALGNVLLQRKMQMRLQRKAADQSQGGAGGGGTRDAGHGIGTAQTRTAVKVRKTPNGERIGALAGGATVTVIGKEGDWYKVELPAASGGTVAYITAQADYVSFTAQAQPTAQAPSLGEQAMSAAGTAGHAVSEGASHLAHTVGNWWDAAVEGVDHVVESVMGGGDAKGVHGDKGGTRAGDKAGPKTGDKDKKPDSKPTGAHYAILDPRAYLRTDPPELKSTGNLIPEGTIVDIMEEKTVKAHAYVKLKQVDSGAVLGWTAKSNLGSDKEADPDLKPEDTADLSKLSGLDLKMAEIYNLKGKYLKDTAAGLGIDAASVAAVLQVESAGHGFAMDGKMIIRFENHIFHAQWGKDNKATFNKHFKFNADKAWTGHQWRRDESGEWVTCHQSQASEWEVIEFARSLADEAALKSASYGAGQVMGFNHETAGFKNVTEMFNQMSGTLRPQLDGMFGFITNNQTCMAGLKAKDYVKFASGYNGSGKADEYGASIESAANAYSRVTKGLKSG